ncbi:hypothetical protein MSG_03525 [Mycobacterium shigaense]|uniref:Uncharacterized protein n=1 Tax=Mycobacterium shigaense TaxID=722731 RepID=A0A1Z4EL59_9MYCO|nr:hypothetical protein MSG_03525 [Mycobacterium shigaense]
MIAAAVVNFTRIEAVGTGNRVEDPHEPVGQPA